MKKKGLMITIAGILIVVMAGFTFNQLRTTVKDDTDPEAIESSLSIDEQEAIAEQERIEAEKENEEQLRLEAEEKARAEAEAAAEAAALEKKLADIEENSYYIGKSGAKVWDAPTIDAVEVVVLDEKTPVYVSEYLKNEAGEIIKMQIKSDIDSEVVMGYIEAGSVLKSLSDFIVRPIEDVDYSAIQKNESFESNPKIDVKGVYVTGHSARGERLQELYDLIDETELNAMVIDVKDDNGYLLFHSESAEKFNPEANNHVYIKDMESFIKDMKDRGIYLIARIVTFKSPIYAKTNIDRAIVYKDSGSLYSDADGLIWASPHDRILWEYNVGIAIEAAKYGFNEIQFDYVRYPAIGNKSRMDYRNKEEESHTATIQKFLKYAYSELSPYEVYVAADVFGWAASALDDVGIGQQWEGISNVVDYMCPMMYPSHYGPNNFGLSVPDAFPYETIDRSLKDAFKRDSNLETPGMIRPWIQDFTAPWVAGYIRYGVPEVKAQIDALKANGINEYLVWNAGNRYSKNAYKEE